MLIQFLKSSCFGISILFAELLTICKNFLYQLNMYNNFEKKMRKKIIISFPWVQQNMFWKVVRRLFIGQNDFLAVLLKGGTIFDFIMVNITWPISWRLIWPMCICVPKKYKFIYFIVFSKLGPKSCKKHKFLGSLQTGPKLDAISCEKHMILWRVLDHFEVVPKSCVFQVILQPVYKWSKALTWYVYLLTSYL